MLSFSWRVPTVRSGFYRSRRLFFIYLRQTFLTADAVSVFIPIALSLFFRCRLYELFVSWPDYINSWPTHIYAQSTACSYIYRSTCELPKWLTKFCVLPESKRAAKLQFNQLFNLVRQFLAHAYCMHDLFSGLFWIIYQHFLPAIHTEPALNLTGLRAALLLLRCFVYLLILLIINNKVYA